MCGDSSAAAPYEPSEGIGRREFWQSNDDNVDLIDGSDLANADASPTWQHSTPMNLTEMNADAVGEWLW